MIVNNVKIPKYRKSYKRNIYVEIPEFIQEFKPDDNPIDTEKRGSRIVYFNEILDKGKKCGGLNHTYLENYV